MIKVAYGFVIAAVVYAVVLGLAGGFDVTAGIIFVLLLGAGALSIASIRRSTDPSVKPALCPQCGGLVSPNAAQCVHCGAELQSP